MSNPTSLDKLIAAGTRMANCCQNLSQSGGGYTLSIREAGSMRGAYVDWDRALLDHRRAVLAADETRASPVNVVNYEAQLEAAQADARLRGMAFLIDGAHVPAERVVIVSPPEGVGPIAEMRAAAAESRSLLAELKAMHAEIQGVRVASEPARISESSIARLAKLCETFGIDVQNWSNDQFDKNLSSLLGLIQGAVTSKHKKYLDLRNSEHVLSDSYVRIREIVGAMNPPSTDPFALYPYVEAKVRAACLASADTARLNHIADKWFFKKRDGTIFFSFNEEWDAGEHVDLRAAIDADMVFRSGS